MTCAEVGRLDEPLVERGRQQVRAHAAKARVRVPGICLGNLPVPCRDDGSAHENSTLATSAWTIWLTRSRRSSSVLRRMMRPPNSLNDQPAGGVEIADDLRGDAVGGSGLLRPLHIACGDVDGDLTARRPPSASAASASNSRS